MKLYPFFPNWFPASFAIVLVCGGWFAPASLAATGPATGTTSTSAGSESAPAMPEVPKSVFNMPNSPQEGRDPFFPNSPRLFAASINKNVVLPVVTPKADLLLKGFSGPPDHRLAIINNRTFAAGESADVHTANGPVRVLCLEIKDDHVSVQVGTERRELRLRNSEMFRGPDDGLTTRRHVTVR